MQLLFQESEESPNFKGIGLINGNVRRIKSKNFKLPLLVGTHVLIIKIKNIIIFSIIASCNPEDKSIITQKLTPILSNYPLALNIKIYGLQFHPEKAQKMDII